MNNKIACIDFLVIGTSGCPWLKATVKSPVGACNLRPLFFFKNFFYCPALAPALPCFEFSFCCQGHEEEVTQGTGSVFFFLLLPRTGGGSYTGNGYLKQDRTYTWWEAFEHMQKLFNRK